MFFSESNEMSGDSSTTNTDLMTADEEAAIFAAINNVVSVQNCFSEPLLIGVLSFSYLSN